MLDLNSKGEVFVKIDSQFDIRTNLLEAAKITTELVKSSEKLNFLLKQKKKEQFKLNFLLSEINSLLNNLEFQDLSWFENKEEIKFDKEIKKEQKQVKKDKLTEDLEEIQRRLNSLKF